MKTLNHLARAVAKQEGKKEQVNIAQILEILKIVSNLIKEDFTVLRVLLK